MQVCGAEFMNLTEYPIHQDGPQRGVHDFDGFDQFIKDCLQEEKFYRYADPPADVIVNMTDEGNGFPWYFDTNNFTVTLAIQNAQSGGAIEFAPRIRESDENFAEVARVMPIHQERAGQRTDSYTD